MGMTTAPQPVTRAAAIGLVTQALRGDFDGVRCALDTCDVDEFVPLFHASLTLLRALALRLRSPEGLMAVDVRLAETSHDEHPNRDNRLAARLILGHAMTRYPPVETIAVAETFGEMFNVGAHTFNAACLEADYEIVPIFVVALAMWRTLIPELGTAAGACVVGNVAGQLWGGIRSEPPKTIQTPGRTTTLNIFTRPDPPTELAAQRAECAAILSNTTEFREQYAQQVAKLPPGVVPDPRGVALLRWRNSQE